MKSILVIGAGFSGAVIARQLADAGFAVMVVDRRDHIGGNAYDYVNDLGIRIHKYGPHIFHTNSDQVVDFLSKFTTWLPYEHKVRARLANGTTVPFPPNREVFELFDGDRAAIINTFFRPYTRKMWGMELEDISPDILNRVPMRPDSDDDRYFTDKFQAMPEHGYTELFKKMLDHRNITVKLTYDVDAKGLDDQYLHVFNSAPIDEWYNYEFGNLAWRSIKFKDYDYELENVDFIQAAPTVNFTDMGPVTRSTEWSQFPGHGHNDEWSTITHEMPCDYRDNNMERYYPVKDIDGVNREIYTKYTALCSKNMTFIGRAGQYVYIDMHQAVNSALQISTKFIESQRNGQF